MPPAVEGYEEREARFGRRAVVPRTEAGHEAGRLYAPLRRRSRWLAYLLRRLRCVERVPLRLRRAQGELLLPAENRDPDESDEFSSFPVQIEKNQGVPPTA